MHYVITYVNITEEKRYHYVIVILNITFRLKVQKFDDALQKVVHFLS